MELSEFFLPNDTTTSAERLEWMDRQGCILVYGQVVQFGVVRTLGLTEATKRVAAVVAANRMAGYGVEERYFKWLEFTSDQDSQDLHGS